ncbi:MAG: NAD(P)/FAD-dependent oxidoreductase [Dehalococcoidales bacterium]
MRVVIVGAGPAGLVSALTLTQQGIKPVVLEKQPTIRSTACGEACDLHSLNKLPFNSNQYICKQLKGAKLIYPDGTCSYLNKSSVTLERTNWLKGMAKEIEARGGQIRLSSEVVTIEEDSLQLKNGERIAYGILIGADGPNSCIARHLGIKHQFVVASQYKIAYDTSDMDYLEFYIDRRFSPHGYFWIFPKDGVINAGVEGDFAQLDAFLKYKGLNSYKIIKREAGFIPASGIQKLVQHNIALIGDSASMPNPFSGGGLAPIIYASQILARHIGNLENYEREVKKHPIATPVLMKARHKLLELVDKDVVNLMNFLMESRRGKVKLPYAVRLLKYPSLMLKLRALISTYRALRITKTYGW